MYVYMYMCIFIYTYLSLSLSLSLSHSLFFSLSLSLSLHIYAYMHVHTHIPLRENTSRRVLQNLPAPFGSEAMGALSAPQAEPSIDDSQQKAPSTQSLGIQIARVGNLYRYFRLKGPMEVLFTCLDPLGHMEVLGPNFYAHSGF